LEELQKEFQEKYGNEIGTAARPYAFVKFGKFDDDLSCIFVYLFIITIGFALMPTYNFSPQI